MYLNYIECPCKNCDKRTTNCHISCEGYKQFRTDYDNEVKRINKERYVDVQIIGMKKERQTHLRRKYGAFKP